jgi:hypothetical protein
VCENHHSLTGPVGGTDRRSFLRAAGFTAGLSGLSLSVTEVLAISPAAAGSSVTMTVTGSFLPGTAPDWYAVPVDVPRGVSEIEVSYSYDRPEPSLPSGLAGNTLDIGVFDAHGFRGWSGGARSSFGISRSSATPGYLAGPIGDGRWQVLLGPYSVAATGLHWQVAVTLHFGPGGPRFEPAPAPRSVAGTGPGWYRGDLHVHSVHSDGRDTLPEVLAAARSAGLDFLASTDHNTSSAGLEWGRVVPDDYLVVNGEEVTTRGGHWTALGIPAGSWIDWRYRVQDGAFPRYAAQVRALGGMVVACHPFSPFPGTTWTFGYDDVDAIEVWNGPWTLDDQTAVEQWHALLVAGHYLPATGSSDSHGAHQPVGHPHTVVRAGSLATGALVDAIRQGRSWLAESAAVNLGFDVAGATCGETATAAATDLLPVRLEVTGVPGCMATVLGPAGPLLVAPADPSGRVVVDEGLPAAAVPFLRVEVRRPQPEVPTDPTTGTPGGPMVALTNPVFVRLV